MPYTLEQLKKDIAGTWKSVAPELRPSSLKNPDGTLKPFYLSRTFQYFSNDTFALEIINFADANGKVPLAKLMIKGQIQWKGPHPIAEGAQKVDFVANDEYEVTPLLPAFADILNQLAAKNFNPWQVNKTQSIMRKEFPPFGLADGQVFSEYDLIYVRSDFMFWGARHIDGRGFDKEENRPANLQIPMIRV